MILTQADKKMKQVFGHLDIDVPSQQRWVTANGYILSYRPNGKVEPDTTICCIKTQRTNERDEPDADYYAGFYHKNLKQAINYLLEKGCRYGLYQSVEGGRQRRF